MHRELLFVFLICLMEVHLVTISPNSGFRCENGIVIRFEEICNKITNRSNRSNEPNPCQPCGRGAFSCLTNASSTPATCIDAQAICNKIVECHGIWDESNCENEGRLGLVNTVISLASEVKSESTSSPISPVYVSIGAVLCISVLLIFVLAVGHVIYGNNATPLQDKWFIIRRRKFQRDSDPFITCIQ